MASYNIEDIRRIVTPIAQQYGVASVSLFGSYGLSRLVIDTVPKH